MKERTGGWSMEPVTRLFAQVARAGPDHELDGAGGLRPRRGKGAGDVIYLGDITTTLLHGLRQAATIEVLEAPRFDEQRWVLSIDAGGLRLRIESRPYWGFGLVGHGYLNELHLSGDNAAADRLIFDLCAALGRDPWTFKHKAAASRVIRRAGLDSTEHAASWTEAVRRGRNGLREDIRALERREAEVVERLHSWLDEVEDDPRATLRQRHLMEAESNLAQARMALDEDHAPGVERALARAEAALIQADPAGLAPSEVDFAPERTLSLDEDLDVVDLT